MARTLTYLWTRKGREIDQPLVVGSGPGGIGCKARKWCSARVVSCRESSRLVRWWYKNGNKLVSLRWREAV